MPDLWIVNQLQAKAVERIQDALKLIIKSKLVIFMNILKIMLQKLLKMFI